MTQIARLFKVKTHVRERSGGQKQMMKRAISRKPASSAASHLHHHGSCRTCGYIRDGRVPKVKDGRNTASETAAFSDVICGMSYSGVRRMIKTVRFHSLSSCLRWRPFAHMCGTDGVVVNGVLGITNSAKKGEHPNFLIFGDIERQTGNLIYPKRPALDLAVELERDIGLSYDCQLLNLAGALQAQDRPYNFTCGQLILTMDIEFDVPIGCIFLGWVILKIFNECQDGYDEIYELSVAGEVATVTIY
ncbi:hypothetical protein B0H17DRAFT_1144175 [Mycena rosella]|uniref:Uncharacterized protein n=1 Tax=Mycena rosella TaxID=1033263 RepID=A0AAD7G375_MYCRO|nr:hypothetical protein B0H17DRAFT_1144175 [Mycena rosella]